MKSILLINAATTDRSTVSVAMLEEYYLPLSLLHLSGALVPHYEVEILDLNQLRPWNLAQNEADSVISAAINKALKKTQPLVVGISSLFSKQIGQVVKIAKLIKKLTPELPIIIGGIHPTIFNEQIIENVPEIDYIIQGEGEESTLKLLKALEKKAPLNEVDGLTYRTSDDQIINQQKKQYIDDLDKIPRPAYHLFDFNQYKTNTSNWHNPKKKTIGVPMPFITSRSCPNRCNFCCMFHVMGPTFRTYSATRVLDDLEFLYHEYGTNYFEFFDDNFTLNKKRTLEICRGIVQRKLDIQIRTTNGLSINTLDDEVVDALAEAGLVWTPIAIESGSEFIRNKVMGKKLDIKKAFEVAEMFHRHPQIILSAFFIIGMPQDTNQTLQESYDLASKLPVDDISIANATPFPGTALYENALNDGSLIEPELGLWDYEESIISNRGNHFFIKPHQMSLNELAHWRKRFDELRLQKMSPKYKAISRTAKEALGANQC